MKTYLKKTISLFLIIAFLSSNLVFAENDKKISKKLTEKVKTIKEKQKKKEKKFAKVVWKADTIIKNYQEKVKKKWTGYNKRNKEKIEAVVKKAKKTKLKLIERANELLKDNLEKDVDEELDLWVITSKEAWDLKQEIQPNYLFELQELVGTDIVPVDTNFSNQWGLQNIVNWEVWNKLLYTWEKVTVAVIDTWVDFSVEDLNWKQWKSETCVDSEWIAIPGWCMEWWYDFVDDDTNPYPSDNYTHGTNVSWIIWANTNNSVWISSIANDNVEIMSLRACCGQWNFFWANDISKAIKFAVNNGADIINASFGGPTDAPEIKEAIEYANNAWVTIVVAAWNYASNNDTNPMYPANYANVLSVGSIDSTENSSYFSNYWNSVDIAAPGSTVYTVDFNNTYRTLDGTSFSTPFVTSVVARYKSQDASLWVVDLKNKLFIASIQNPALSWKVNNGMQLKLDASSIEKALVESGEVVVEEEFDIPLPNPPLPGEGTWGDVSWIEIDERYVKFMKQISKLRKWKISQESTKDTISLQEVSELEAELQTFITSERVRLLSINGVDELKISRYISLLNDQLDLVKNYNTTINNESNQTTVQSSSVQDFQAFSIETLSNLGIEQKEASKDIQTLSDMSSFSFWDSVENIGRLSDYKMILESRVPTSSEEISFLATESFVPVQLEDLQENEEVIISSDIQDLATELHNNPVSIFNYVKNNIEYEPYSGVKKTSTQCLRDRSCNDYDSSSLLISLLRASGIPARYKQSHILVWKDNVNKLLWVSDIKSAYYALSQGKIPVYIMSNGSPIDSNFETADFSGVTQLVVKWTFAEMYYDYDHRWANHSNDVYFSDITTQAELDTRLVDYSNREWLKIDPTFKFTLVWNEVSDSHVIEDSTIDTHTFFESYLQTWDTDWALEAYKKKLIETSPATDDTELALYNFNKNNQNTHFEMLPVTFPYSRITWTTSSGVIIEDSAFSTISDTEKQKIEIELKDSTTWSVVLKKSYKVTEINNIPLDLHYQWATQADIDIIESYGSLHLTPSNLVNIQPAFVWAEFNTVEWETITDNIPVKIWDQLILTFRYFVNGVETNVSSKFSTAWNREGIYLNFSKIVSDTMDTDSKVLLAWNWAIAKKYLERLEIASNELEQIFNRENTLNYSRAVVTQNRILNEINGDPTTFEFKWLTLDAHSYIGDYYRWTDLTNSYKKYSSEFWKIYGLYASEQEGQIFDDITGLTGISTVKGLQYAYANPADYTIHKIDSSNKSVIDSLILSENTKTLMGAYVDEWRTITTPNKLVKNQTWEGLFYTAIDSDGEWVYAIGEGVAQNGGFSVDEMLDMWEGVNGALIACIENWATELLANTCSAFKNYETVNFSYRWIVKSNDEQSVKDLFSWEESNGQLITTSYLNYGYHNLLFTKNWVIFDNSWKEIKNWDYKYFISYSDISTKLKNHFSDLEKMHLSLDVWTFFSDITSSEYIYYSPNPNAGNVYSVKWAFLKKLKKTYRKWEVNTVQELLWFPTWDELWWTTIESNVGYKYKSQPFINGNLYRYENFYNIFPNTVYTYWALEETLTNNWSVTALWLPADDPDFSGKNDIIQEYDSWVLIKLNQDWETNLVSDKRYACYLANNSEITSKTKLRLALIHWFFSEIQDVIWLVPELIFGISKWIIRSDLEIRKTEFYLDDIKDLLIEVSKIRLSSIKNFFLATWNGIWSALYDEMNSSDTTCPLRESYVIWKIWWTFVTAWLWWVWTATKIEKINEAKRLAKLINAWKFDDIVKAKKFADGKFNINWFYELNYHFWKHGENFWLNVDNLNLKYKYQEIAEKFIIKGGWNNVLEFLQKSWNAHDYIRINYSDEIIWIYRLETKEITTFFEFDNIDNMNSKIKQILNNINTSKISWNY